MFRFAVAALVSYLTWLALTFPLALSLNVQNLISGIFVALCVAFISRGFLFHSRPGKALNPLRWGYFVAYLFMMLIEEINSHLDVAYRVITGRINPGIVRVRMSPERDIGKTLLGCSITLTPGTVVIAADDALYMHAIEHEKGHDTSDFLGKITRRVAE